jgi:hypothetical protein
LCHQMRSQHHHRFDRREVRIFRSLWMWIDSGRNIQIIQILTITVHHHGRWLSWRMIIVVIHSHHSRWWLFQAMIIAWDNVIDLWALDFARSIYWMWWFMDSVDVWPLSSCHSPTCQKIIPVIEG